MLQINTDKKTKASWYLVFAQLLDAKQKINKLYIFINIPVKEFA